MASGTRKTVLAAIGGNALLTVLKFGAATVGHSPSMMNEAVHSLVDTANQVLLLLGLHFSLKPPDQEYAFGHGQKKYLWNLWSAIGIFSIGCGLGLAHTWHAWGKMNGPNASNPVQIVNVGTIDAVWISLIVLAFSFIIECIVLRLAWREFVRRSREAVRISTIKNLLQSADPTLLAILLEDSIAVAGVALAVTGIILTRLTGNGLWDIGFSGLIALVLGITAVILGRINIRFLTDIRDPQAEAVFIDIVRKYR